MQTICQDMRVSLQEAELDGLKYIWLWYSHQLSVNLNKLPEHSCP